MITRRTLLLNAGVLSLLNPLDASAQVTAQDQNPADRKTIDDWILDRIARTRDVGNPLKIGRFADSMYYLTDSISWTPTGNQTPTYPSVTARTGFVTDFTSIPRAFWQFLPRDGDYAYGAVLHDYLYWFQPTSREKADDIFKFVMEEFGLNRVMIATVYQTLRLFGGSAWDSNAKLRGSGEKRVLARLPDRATRTWEDWKKDPRNFE
jgi:hypothetical protein